jgi:superfamily I DNA and RNA helicase
MKVCTWYLAGSRYDAIINERDLTAEAHVDTTDYDAALQRVSSRSHFVVVEDELELQKMLNAPLEQWRVFLHPMQCKLAEGYRNGAVRVLGGAGTGKTVVAMHRAKWLTSFRSSTLRPSRRSMPTRSTPASDS